MRREISLIRRDTSLIRRDISLITALERRVGIAHRLSTVARADKIVVLQVLHPALHFLCILVYLVIYDSG